MACSVEDEGFDGGGIFLNATRDIACLRPPASVEGFAFSLSL